MPLGAKPQGNRTVQRPYRAETIDEYRELDMLAHAWERGSLEPGVLPSAPARAEDAEGTNMGVDTPAALRT
jgi:hypothetical protein